MTDLELNKALHEKVMDECWHEWKWVKKRDGGGFYHCEKCNEKPDNKNSKDPTYTTNPADYWRLLQKVKEHPDSLEFHGWLARRVADFCEKVEEPMTAYSLITYMQDMPRGCQAIYEFFCKEG